MRQLPRWSGAISHHLRTAPGRAALRLRVGLRRLGRWSGAAARRLLTVLGGVLRQLPRWYGANPLHLLTLLGSFALAGYAADRLLPLDIVGIAVWVGGAVIGHDLLLAPLYTLADRSVTAVIRHRPAKLPAVQWINYLRVPVVLSGLLLLIWFPLIFRLPTGFPAATTLSLNPYLWHWVAVTGALFLLSAAALALRLRADHRRTRRARTPDAGPPDHPEETPDHPGQRGALPAPGQARSETPPPRDWGLLDAYFAVNNPRSWRRITTGRIGFLAVGARDRSG